MVKFILRALVVAVGFWVAAHFVPGVHIHGWKTLLAASVLLGIANGLVRPIVTLLTLPITIITLGLFLLVVNAITVWLVTVFIHAIHIHGFISLILTVIVLGIVSWAASGLIGMVTDRDNS